jgi:hypothetical protein
MAPIPQTAFDLPPGWEPPAHQAAVLCLIILLSLGVSIAATVTGIGMALIHWRIL